MRARWEGLATWQQAAVAFPLLWLFTFLLNLGPFAQPLGSCIIYGVIEGGLFTGMMLAATSAEKRKRAREAGGESDGKT
jgi:hypothetical protein